MDCLIKIIIGDCRDVLRTLPDESVHCVVSSPPYWGLRDYGVVVQIGLEPNFRDYVATLVDVFREVRRVLRKDGTLWLNLGDSYAAGGRGGGANGSKQQTNVGSLLGLKSAPDGLKPKDLCGIPWRVAFALQQPFYAGKIKNEMDRVWMAAMLDAEGCITASEYDFNGRKKTNIYIMLTNSSVPIIEKCERLFPQEGKHVYEKGGVINRLVFRWDVERMEKKSLFLREVYPYLVAKRKQAILGYTFVEMQQSLYSKKRGYLSEQQEKRSWLVRALSRLNQGQDVDLPDWAIEPPSLFEPGFYLRQDLIWAKPNPMPESVTDRCTKAHEYLFLLSKSARYYYDADAIAEVSIRAGDPFHGRQNLDRAAIKAVAETRNKRSVWEIATAPFSETHFATFPPALIEPCILAGCPKECCAKCGAPIVRQIRKSGGTTGKGWTDHSADATAGMSQAIDVRAHSTGYKVEMLGWSPSCFCNAGVVAGTVLDPFGGAGTTGLVADRLGRNAILIELNPEYAAMAEHRIKGDAPLFTQVTNGPLSGELNPLAQAEPIEDQQERFL
jgi:DNA modification methylase